MISVRGLAGNRLEKNDRASTAPLLIIRPFGLRLIAQPRVLRILFNEMAACASRAV